jgi:hypothetical protein
LKICLKGYVNGWYYPFIYQKHLDDPRHKESLLKSNEDIQKWAPLSAINNGVKTLKDWENQLSRSAFNLQQASIDPVKYLKFSRLLHSFYRIVYSKGLKAWYDL